METAQTTINELRNENENTKSKYKDEIKLLKDTSDEEKRDFEQKLKQAKIDLEALESTKEIEIQQLSEDVEGKFI